MRQKVRPGLTPPPPPPQLDAGPFQSESQSVSLLFSSTSTSLASRNTDKYRDLLIVLPMREPSIFRGIAVSLLRPVIGSNVEIDVVALNWVADVRKQIRSACRTN